MMASDVVAWRWHLQTNYRFRVRLWEQEASVHGGWSPPTVLITFLGPGGVSRVGCRHFSTSKGVMAEGRTRSCAKVPVIRFLTVICA